VVRSRDGREREREVHSSGRTSLIRYRKSGLPVECAIRSTPRPYTRAEGGVEHVRALDD
jgi:hypothetical protein